MVDRKNEIADAFRGLILLEDGRAVSVRRICRACGIGKNTFYYYFEDRDDLVRWVFHRGLAKKLLETRSQDEMCFPSHPKYAEFAFYPNARSEDGDLSLSWYWVLLGEYFREESALVRFSTGADSPLKRYLYEAYSAELFKDLEYLANSIGAMLETEDLTFLSAYYTSAIVECYFDANLLRMMNRGRSEKFANISHDSMKRYLESFTV